MADDIAIVGVWLLRSFQVEDVASGLRADTFGPDPRGVLLLHHGGRMMVLVTRSASNAILNDADRVAAYQNLVAYSGRYRLEAPDRFVTSVDVSWFPDWVGTEQARSYRLDGDTLDIVTDPLISPRTGDALVRGVLSWEREKVVQG